MKALHQLAEENPNVMLLTADLGYGVFESFEEKHPKQFLNVGVAEQNMIGIASGLALEGKVVFVYSIGNFPTLRCLEQIRNDACYHNLNINIIAMGGGFSYGALGMSHHATEDLGIMRTLPNVTVVAPTTAFEAEMATYALSQAEGVGYLRIDKSQAVVTSEKDKFVLGNVRELIKGTDYVVFVTGGIAEEAVFAANELCGKNISLRVISVPTIKPLNHKDIIKHSSGMKGVISLEEGNVINGLGAAILDVFALSNSLPNVFFKFGIQDEYIATVGSQSYLRTTSNIDKNAIVAKVLEWDSQ
jgi:transketolase